jgi:hypothetical protein
MTRRLQATVAAVAACTLALCAGIVLVHDRGGSDPGTAVLGRSVDRTSTTAAAVAATIPTPAVVVETTTTTVLAPAVASTTTTIDVPPTTARTTTTVAIRQVVEQNDNVSTFDYLAEGSSASNTPAPAGEGDPFLFNAYGSDVDHDGVAELRADIANQTDQDVSFPGGLVLHFVLSRDGGAARTVELKFPDELDLPAHGSVEIESATTLEQYGHYAVTADVTVEYR